MRIFRVDNPHTKPVVFWEKVIADINRTDPDVIFLAEAFTRPAMMRTLGQIGFQQSYTYFTWRNTKARADRVPDRAVRRHRRLHAAELLRQHPRHPARATSSTAAARPSRCGRCSPRPSRPTWGVYAGYELCENTPVRPGSEEYLDSEKYELRPRDWAAAEREGRTIAPLITTLNRLRRRHPALQQLRDIHFHPTDNERGDRLLASARATNIRTGGRQPRPAPHPGGDGLVGHAGTRPRLARVRRRCATSSPARPITGAGPTTCA